MEGEAADCAALAVLLDLVSCVAPVRLASHLAVAALVEGGDERDSVSLSSSSTSMAKLSDLLAVSGEAT